MSDYTIHEETYEHKNGKSYHVEVSADDCFGPPDEEHDGHGVIVELDFDPDDEGAVDDYIERETEEGSTEEMEERARMALMRLIGNGSRYGKNKYYDVWETRKKALKDWGVDKARVDEVVDKDYKYIDGWYSDDWHWVCVSVYALDEHGEKDEDYAHHCGGYESSIIDRDQRDWFEEVIEDGIAQVEHDIRKDLHKNQMELPLEFA
jgi:hypothetical protein